VKRREFITLLGGAAGWPLAARAQQGDRMRRIGVLMSTAADDPVGKARRAAFLQGLQQFGWTEGHNVRIDYRWAAAGADRFRSYAAELVALAPDVIVATGAPGTGPLLQATRTVPIVFVNVADPVGAGYVDSLARPGGNATGFITFEYGLSGKWLELLKEIAPRVTRAGILRDAALTSGTGQFAAIQSVAPTLGVEVSPINLRNVDEIERAIAAFARTPNGGLIVTGSALAIVHRDLIVASAARHKLPAVYWNRTPVADGGLISYGPDLIDQYRSAAGYIDRILKGEKPADLPVQAPTKYELVINLKTAKALGLEVTFAALKSGTQALYVCGDALVISNHARINTLALSARMATMHDARAFVQGGGLIAYGANFPDMFRRAAEIVDKILRGAKPAEIPVEQPTKFDLVINVITARALGLEIPATLLARADEVIE
jgi:putative tryptophan/tyrosine transport system substrate-binding protein